MDREAPKHIDQGIRLAGSNRYDLWKFYQDRADTIRARLWTIGTWLVALISALAALAHQGDIIGLRPGFPGIAILLPWPAFFIAMMGLILVILTLFIVFDNLKHIVNNFTYANYISSEQWIPATLPRHTRNGAYTLEIILFLFLVGYGCILYLSGRAVLGDRPDVRAAVPTEAAKVTFLTINDVYRIEGVDRGARGGLPRLRALRHELQKADPELLVLHGGDVIAPSLLSATYDGAQMIDMLNRLDADALAFDPRMFAVFGNHEFDKQELGQAGILADRVRESQFSWLRSNLGFALDGGGLPLVRGANLLESTIVEAHGVKVGLFGLTTDVTQPAYVIKIDDPLESARRFSRMLRAEGADLVVALTHLTLAEDMAILEGLGTAGPDLIIGGHEHTRQMAEVGGRWVLKADADAVGAWVVKVTPRPGEPPLVEPEYRLLAGDQPLPDGQLSRDVAAWRTRHDQEFCAREKAPPGCLDQQVGETATRPGRRRGGDPLLRDQLRRLDRRSDARCLPGCPGRLHQRRQPSSQPEHPEGPDPAP
jgi:hypothetical protein